MPKYLPTGLSSMLPLCPNVSLCSCQQNLHKLLIGWNRDGIVNLTLDLSAFSLLSVIFVFFLLRVYGRKRETGKKESESWILAPPSQLNES